MKSTIDYKKWMKKRWMKIVKKRAYTTMEEYAEETPTDYEKAVDLQQTEPSDDCTSPVPETSSRGSRKDGRRD